MGMTRTATETLQNTSLSRSAVGRAVSRRQPPVFLVVGGSLLARRRLEATLCRLWPGGEIGQLENLAGFPLTMTWPDLVLVDPDQSDETGTASIERLAVFLPGVPVIMVAAVGRVEHAWAWIRAGARGVVPKPVSPEVLEASIALVLSGHDHIPLPGIVATPGDAATNARSRREVVGTTVRLTRRQMDIFHLIRAGCTNKVIARELGLLEGTVKVHVRAVMKKLGVGNRTQIAVAAASGQYDGEVR